MTLGIRLLAPIATCMLVSQSQPVFRSGVAYVEINAVVTDKHGAFVRGLTRDDFEVLENRKAQEVTVATLIDLPRLNSSEGANARPAPSTPPGDAGKAPQGRVYVIVLDTMHVDPSRTLVLRRRAREFIERYLGPSDQAAVAHIGYPGLTQDFTSDVGLLSRSVDRAIGERAGSESVAAANADPDLTAIGASPDREARLRRYMAERSISDLAGLATRLGEVPRSRRALVLFSEGLQVDVTDPRNTSLLDEVRRLYSAAARANVTLYTIDPRGVPSIGDDMMQVGQPRRGAPSPALALYREHQVAQQSLRNLAEQTGGLAWVGSADFGRGFRAIVDDNSTYYLLGYYSSDATRDDTYRTLTVRVKRKGVVVRARKGYSPER